MKKDSSVASVVKVAVLRLICKNISVRFTVMSDPLFVSTYVVMLVRVREICESTKEPANIVEGSISKSVADAMSADQFVSACRARDETEMKSLYQQDPRVINQLDSDGWTTGEGGSSRLLVFTCCNNIRCLSVLRSA